MVVHAVQEIKFNLIFFVFIHSKADLQRAVQIKINNSNILMYVML